MDYNRRNKICHVYSANLEVDALLEGPYKTALTKRIEKRWGPLVMVFRLDPDFRQGIPDMLLLFEGGFWATLEGKRNAKAPYRPNQQYYVELMDRLCFSAFIYPENEEAVLNELEEAYQSHRQARHA